MKIVPVISIHDALIGYKNIIIEHNTATAVRGFTNSIRCQLDAADGSAIDVRDLSLYHVGDFNLETGEIIPCEPKLLVTGTDIFSFWKQEIAVNSYSSDDPFDA